jgi:hypothetical protein
MSRSMRKKRTQIIFFLAWTTTSLIFYVAVPFCYEIVNYNSDVENSSVSLGCDFIDYNSQMIASYMDLTMRDILPFMVMSIFSILLIISIFRTRMRAASGRTVQYLKRLARDIRFSIMILFMNLLFIVLSLPLAIVLFIPGYNTSFSFILTFYIFYSSYGVNFYVMFFTNSLFRNEVITFVLPNKIQNSTTTPIDQDIR